MQDCRTLQEVLRFAHGKVQPATDIVVQERPFSIFVQDAKLVTLACLPTNVRALTRGFLLSEGFVDVPFAITAISLDEARTGAWVEADIPPQRLKRFLQTAEKSSGCGSSLSGSGSLQTSGWMEMTISATQLIGWMQQFRQSSELFKETGGVHSAALVHEGAVRFFAEDIGRHNAVDKVIGMAMEAAVPLTQCILLSSGRISAEIVRKAIRARLPLICSQSAPTSEAIRLGWQYHRYLIGFARNQRFTLYTGFKTIQIKS